MFALKFAKDALACNASFYVIYAQVTYCDILIICKNVFVRRRWFSYRLFRSTCSWLWAWGSHSRICTWSVGEFINERTNGREWWWKCRVIVGHCKDRDKPVARQLWLLVGCSFYSGGSLWFWVLGSRSRSVTSDFRRTPRILSISIVHFIILHKSFWNGHIITKEHGQHCSETAWIMHILTFRYANLNVREPFSNCFDWYHRLNSTFSVDWWTDLPPP